jgi:hypothetical protein
MGVKRARRQVEALLGAPARAVGLFAVPDPEVAAGFVALAAGGAALGAMLATVNEAGAVGEAADRLITLLGGATHRPAGMPRHVLVVVTDEGVTLFAHSRHMASGKRVVFFGAGHLKAHASMYPFNIDLSIAPDSGVPLVLSGKRGPRHGVAQTVKAALALAGGSDGPVPGERLPLS